MWKKNTKYTFSLPKNLIYEFCSQVYEKGSDFDLVFVTRGNYFIQAHRVILALSSDLVKELNPDFERILLPDYSKSVVEAFVELLYSGTISIDLNDYTDFISLCKEMKVDAPNFGRDTEEQLGENINDEMEID